MCISNLDVATLCTGLEVDSPAPPQETDRVLSYLLQSNQIRWRRLVAAEVKYVLVPILVSSIINSLHWPSDRARLVCQEREVQK